MISGPMSFEPVQECVTAQGYQPVLVPSHSSGDPDAKHMVLTAPWLNESEYICDCLGFRYRSTCRHQSEAAAKVCGWTELEGPEQQSLAQRKLKQCPRCGSNTRWVVEFVDD